MLIFCKLCHDNNNYIIIIIIMVLNGSPYFISNSKEKGQWPILLQKEKDYDTHYKDS